MVAIKRIDVIDALLSHYREELEAMTDDDLLNEYCEVVEIDD